MAQQSINVGTSANDGTGDPLRTAFNKINSNFTELYGTSAFDTQVTISGNSISANESNADLVLNGSGTGGIVTGAIRIDGTSLSSTDSTQININENLDVGGNITASGDITATGNIFAKGNINLGDAAGDQTKVTGVFEADQLQIDGTTMTSTVTNGDVTITGNGSGGVNIDNLTFNDNSITSASNADINITPGGTGNIVAGAVTINGTTLSAADSSSITVAEALDVTGTLTGTSASLSTTLAVTGATTLSGATTVNNSLTATSLMTNTISSNGSNADLSIQPSGTGDVVISALRVNGTTLDSSDSTVITVAETLNVTGTLNTADVSTTGATTVSGALTAGSINVGDLNISADGTITTDTNGDININPAGSGVVVLSSDVTHTGTQTTTGQLNVDSLRLDGNVISATAGSITLSPAAGTNVVLGPTAGGIVTAPEIQATTGEFVVLRASRIENDISNHTLEIGAQGSGVVKIGQTEISASASTITGTVTNGDITISPNGTGAVTTANQLTLTGSFKQAIHTITATDAITEAEHSGRTLLLGEVGGNANVVLTLPDATGSGNIYHFIVSVAMGGSTTYKIQVADADNTITGQIMYLDEDGTAVTSFPTVAASDTVTLNSGTQGGLVGDTLTLIDIATDKYAVSGQMRVSAGANPATPFTAAVS